MKRLALFLLVIIVASVWAQVNQIAPNAQPVQGPVAAGGTQTGNPMACGTVGSASVVLNCVQGDTTTQGLTAAAVATTLIIAGVAAKHIYITAGQLTASGVGTLQVKSGTGSTCGTGTVNLTGAMTTAAGIPIGFGSGIGFAMRTQAVGDSLCIAMTGTGITAAGWWQFAVI